MSRYPLQWLVIIILFGTFIVMVFGAVTDSHNSRVAVRELMTDVKARCKPVYNTIEGKRMTTIYSCPVEDGGDDIKYEFTDRL